MVRSIIRFIILVSLGLVAAVAGSLLAIRAVLSVGDRGFTVYRGEPAIISWGGSKRISYVSGADPETFVALEGKEGAEAIYAADATRVYVGVNGSALPIEGSDPQTFTILRPDGTYAADTSRVYWYGIELPGAEPQSFRLLQPPYAVDSERAYVGVLPLEVHSIRSFEVLQVSGFNLPVISQHFQLVVKDKDKAYVSGWSRDGVAYYWGTTELKGADYDSLTILNGLYAKDKNKVYYKGKPISGADAESFVTVGPGDISGRDKNYEYEKGERVGRAK